MNSFQLEEKQKQLELFTSWLNRPEWPIKFFLTREMVAEAAEELRREIDQEMVSTNVQ